MKTYDLRQDDNGLRRLWQEIEPRHDISWRNRQHSLSGSEMTDEKAKQFISRHRKADVLFAVILDYGVVVYLKETAT